MVTSIAFDPDLWILSKNNSVQNGTVITGIKNNLITDKVNLFPNPVNTILTIDLSDRILRENLNFNIYNTLGAIIKTGLISNSNTKIDVADLSTGTYFIELLNETERSTGRFIKL